MCVVRPAGEVQELVFVRSSGFILQLPQQNADEMRVLDDDGNLLEHVLESHAGLLQPVHTEKRLSESGSDSCQRFLELTL